ncbi:MAG: YmfL family putative regulatory protein [Proteus vulgaris]
MSKQSIKQIVKEICDEVQGGREAMAGALGLSLTSFNNKLYEKNGCRSFDLNELLAMQDISKTVLFAEFIARESGMLLVERIKPDEIDEPELFRLHSKVGSNQGELAIFLEKSLEDGVVDSDEEKQLNVMLDRVIASGRAFVNAFISLHRKKK